MQVATNTFLNLIHATLHLAICEVLVAGVDGLKLASVNCYAGIDKQIELAA